jgi:hypothetical protein
MNHHLAIATQFDQSSPEVQLCDRVFTTQEQQLQGKYDPDGTLCWVRSLRFPLHNELGKSTAWLEFHRICMVSDRYGSSKLLIQIDSILSLSSFSKARQDLPPCML